MSEILEFIFAGLLFTLIVIAAIYVFGFTRGVKKGVRKERTKDRSYRKLARDLDRQNINMHDYYMQFIRDKTEHLAVAHEVIHKQSERISELEKPKPKPKVKSKRVWKPSSGRAKPISTAKRINCGCGCFGRLWDRDAWGRKRRYISGHQNRPRRRRRR